MAVNTVTLEQPDTKVPKVIVTIELDCTAADKNWDNDLQAKKKTDAERLSDWYKMMFDRANAAINIQRAKATLPIDKKTLDAQAKAKAEQDALVAAAVLVDKVS